MNWGTSMRAPEFWDRPSWQSYVLSPLAWIYARATARRLSKPAKIQSTVPVICVGNINAGGTGKTPATIAITQMLKEMGKSVAVVSRGYGGSMEGPVQVTNAHSASEVGDEPLLMAAFTDVFVAKDRATGVLMAQNHGAEVVLMDDGFQNPDVKKDLSIVVVDAVKGFGNGKVLPAGPLREPVGVGLSRADLVLSVGHHEAQTNFERRWADKINIPHLKAHLDALPTGMPWSGLKCLAFAGIGHPEKFFASLRAEGADVVRGEALKDHQPLSEALMMRLENEAKVMGLQLVTTEKDAVRLPDNFRSKVLTLPVRLMFQDDTALRVALKELGIN